MTETFDLSHRALARQLADLGLRRRLRAQPQQETQAMIPPSEPVSPTLRDVVVSLHDRSSRLRATLQNTHDRLLEAAPKDQQTQEIDPDSLALRTLLLEVNQRLLYCEEIASEISREVSLRNEDRDATEGCHA